MVLLHEEEKRNGRRGAEAPHSSEPQKAHPIGEFEEPNGR